jgi:hypothetical protein
LGPPQKPGTQAAGQVSLLGVMRHRCARPAARVHDHYDLGKFQHIWENPAKELNVAQ